LRPTARLHRKFGEVALAHYGVERHHLASGEGANMNHLVRKLWSYEEGQDIAEYAVMLAVILILVIGTIRLVGGNANNTFSTVASSIQ
jgi:Flp pilus assembly pilin Flp